MVYSWFSNILSCFSHTQTRRKQQQEQTQSSHSSIYHTFSPPLKVCMLRKIRCRIQPQTSLKKPLLNCSLNISHNCTEIIPHTKQRPSLIVIDIDNDDLSQQTSTKNIRTSANVRSSLGKSKSKSHFYRRSSYVQLDISKSSLSISSHRHCHLHRYSSSYIHKKQSNSISSSSSSSLDYSSHNTNSLTNDSPPPPPPLSDATISKSNSTDEVATSINKTTDKTWRLKIHDDLNKDGSRHFVIHKGSEESIRQRRQDKRAKRSEEKKQKINEKISKANQRWQKYSNIDYELVFFISRYYDQLPLCSSCQNYFVTHQVQFLSEQPRASLDYAADAVLRSFSSSQQTMTMKQAAKTRLIKDYDKQTDIIFHLCDTCLTKCEQIRNELKQINVTQKLSPQLIRSPSLSPSVKILTSDDNLFSPLPSPTKQDQQHQNTITDVNQLYMNNLLQYHQIKLQQLYQQTQSIIVAQQYQQNYPFNSDHQQEQLEEDLRCCLKQMQYHCLEMLHVQYPGYILSFPYTPSSSSSSNPQYLSYRHQQIDDDEDDECSESRRCSSTDGEDENVTSIDNDRYCEMECDKNKEEEEEESIDDRLRIETCHGCVEYCNAPLDDFIRGLQVLKCLSGFSRHSS